MAEEKDPAAPQAVTGVDEPKKEVPTLDSINEKLETVIKENDRLKKQNSDKDSFISKLEGENKGFRDTFQKATASIEGKTEKQKDAMLDNLRGRFTKEGYDEKSVDLILDAIVTVSSEKARQQVVPLIMESAQELVESDVEIDKEFLEKNQDAVTEEYQLFKPEVSPRRIKANLKKAYNIVKERLTEKAKGQAPQNDREAMLKGSTTPAGSTKEPSKDDFVDKFRAVIKPSNSIFD